MSQSVCWRKEIERRNGMPDRNNPPAVTAWQAGQIAAGLRKGHRDLRLAPALAAMGLPHTANDGFDEQIFGAK
jgi:hypothetical protein